MKPLKIMIVDDNLDYAEGMADILESKGHVSVIARSGSEALARISNDDIDLTFMDVRMPGMNGVEACKAVLEIKPDAKVVIMTAYSVESLLEEAIEHGVHGVLHKPLDMEEVFQLINNIRNSAILLVDDDPDFTRRVTEILETQGYRVETASTGDAAIKRIIENQISILLIDLTMPGMDGIEVIRRLDQLGRHVPTVLLTGQMSEEQDQLLNFNSPLLSGVLPKPVHTQDLLELISQIDQRQ